MQRDELLSIYRFHIAANDTVLDVAAQLSADDLKRTSSPSHDSVWQLLVHILGGDVFFPAACQAQTPDMGAVEALATFDDLRTCFADAAQNALTFLEGLEDADLHRDVVLTFGEHSFTLKLWQVIMQQFTHAHMHRGELSIVLSQMGHPLPTIDLMVHFIKAAGQEWPFG